ncbi:MAG: ankyrin [Candidatus Aadella gelida]|nr:ankyrin [Candidatus Aadella gelida]
MRDVNTLKGLHGLRTLHSSKKSSIPKVQSSSYLDLYVMGKEKERLLKEAEKLGQKDTIIKKRLKEIEHEMNKLQEDENFTKSSKSTGSFKNVPDKKKLGEKEWKTMPLDY